MPMKASIKKKWVRALRSGKYKQGRIGLHHKPTNSFCCLGVLCDVQGLAWDKNFENSAWTMYIFPRVNGVIGQSSASIKEEYADHIGLTGEDQGTLVSMNDSGISFSEIADYIEENL